MARNVQTTIRPTETECPVCGVRLVLPIGPPGARGLIVGDRPGEWELERGRPFVPQAPAGRVLHHEMIRAGLCLDDFRMTNVWLHAPNDVCLDWHVEQCRREAHGRQAVLLLGSIACRAFLEQNVMQVSGLVIKVKDAKTRMLPKGTFVVSAPNPAEVLHGSVGELRLSLKRFFEAYKKLKGKT